MGEILLIMIAVIYVMASITLVVTPQRGNHAALTKSEKRIYFSNKES